MRFATVNCTAEVSNIKITKQSTDKVKYYGFFGYGDTYDEATDTLTLTMYKQSWSIPNIPFIVNQPTTDHSVAFDLKFNDAMEDAKFGLTVAGNHTYWIENKLSQSGDNSKIHVAGKDNNEWGETGFSIDKNLTIHFVITFTKLDSGKFSVAMTAQADGGKLVDLGQAADSRDNCKLGFKVFNEKEADMAKTVSISNLVITAK